MKNKGLEEWIPVLISRWRNGGNGKGPLSLRELDRLGKALFSLQRGLTGSRSLIGSSYMDNADLAGVYLLYYWISSYAQVRHILGGIEALYGIVPSGAVLDIGAGSGPASAAFADSGSSRVTALEPSGAALATLAALFETRYGPSFPPPVAINGPAQKNRSGGLEAGSPYGAIVFSHALNEIASGSETAVAERADLVACYARLLDKDGFILLQEPSLLSTSRDLLSVRDTLVEKGFRVLAPCFTQLPCPARAKGPNETCHEEFSWKPPHPVEELAKRAGLDRASLKMTYMVLAKAIPERKIAPEENLFRVVSDSMLNKAGKRRFFLCGERGRFTLSARPDFVPDTARVFLSMQRGNIVSFRGTIASENGESVTGETSLENWTCRA